MCSTLNWPSRSLMSLLMGVPVQIQRLGGFGGGVREGGRVSGHEWVRESG